MRRRSEFFRQAVRGLPAYEREREAVERHLEGYRRNPERPEEVAEAVAMSRDALAGEPWE